MAWLFADSIYMLENELISGLRKKQKSAFDHLYARYAGMLYLTISVVIPDAGNAQDILKKVFKKIWVDIAEYDSSKIHLYTWMSRIARDYAKSYSKSDTAQVRSPHHSVASPRDAILEMVYLQGASIREVTTQLCLHEHTVKSHLRESVAQLNHE